MKISVIGSGWVGENIGIGLSELGHDIIFHDISEDKIQRLREAGYRATADVKTAVLDSGVSILCVPTPNRDGSIDLTELEKATESLASSLRNQDNYHLVAVKSTVVPGTSEEVLIPILEEETGMEAGTDFGFCVNPEFMTEIADTWTDRGDFKKNFFSEDRVVIGELDEKSGDVLEEIYKPLGVPILRMDLKTAEMTKYASNCMLAAKISYWNQIFLLCEELGVDSDVVAKAAAMDDRIGEYGTVHGKAFGGKCLPKDLRAFIDFAENRIGEEAELLKAVENINRLMKKNYGVRE